MTIRPIVIVGEPVLHRATTPVSVFDDELSAFLAALDEVRKSGSAPTKSTAY